MPLTQNDGETRPRAVLSIWRGLTRRPVTMREIATDVARRRGVTLDEMIRPGSCRELAEARWEAFHEIRRQTRYSLPQIGRFFGGRDHTTVLHGLRRHAERMGVEA